MTETISFDDFLKVDIRCGTVVSAEPYPEARKPAIKMKIDFGDELGIKQTSAQVTHHYSPESLVGLQVTAVVNFPPKQIGKFMSEVLVVGFETDEKTIQLLHPNGAVPNGAKLC